MESPAFPPESERSMVDFMNAHYAHSNLMYAKVYGQLWQATEARMVALDKEGMELDVIVPDGAQRIRIAFAQRVQNEGDAQQTLVEMSFNARDILAQQARPNG
jgi:putative heme iron utilization protein